MRVKAHFCVGFYFLRMLTCVAKNATVEIHLNTKSTYTNYRELQNKALFFLSCNFDSRDSKDANIFMLLKL